MAIYITSTMKDLYPHRRPHLGWPCLHRIGVTLLLSSIQKSEASHAISKDEGTGEAFANKLSVTSDAFIAGRVYAGGISAKGDVEARSISCSHEMKSPLIESTGTIRGINLEVKNSVKVDGVLKGNQVDSQKLQTGLAEAKSIVTDYIEVKGKIKCTGEASFLDQIYEMGEVVLERGVDVQGDITTKKLCVSEKAEATSIHANSLTASTSIKTKSLISSDIHSTDIDVNLLTTKELRVGGKTTMNQLDVNHGNVKKI